LKAYRNEENVYIFGDLQDTPDNSKAFHYSSTKIAKHPLGTVKTCEDLGLQCTIDHHWDTMDRPIISRHGSKGGRFIDRMYTMKQGLTQVTGITIIQDTGIYSDHDHIISKLDLGIIKFKISKDKEEQFDFCSVMNTPVSIRQGQNHPSLSDTIFKGMEFKKHAALYHTIQRTIKDPKHNFLNRVQDIKRQLEEFEREIISRTKNSIGPEDQANGKLIQRIPSDAQMINDLSVQFFNLIHDICRQVNLSKMV